MVYHDSDGELFSVMATKPAVLKIYTVCMEDIQGKPVFYHAQI